MTWQGIVSLIISLFALIVGVLNLRHVKDVQKSKDLKEQFTSLEEDVETLQNKLDDTMSSLRDEMGDCHKEISRKMEDLFHAFAEIGVLKEKVLVGEKYRDKFDDKLNEIIKIIYKGDR